MVGRTSALNAAIAPLQVQLRSFRFDALYSNVIDRASARRRGADACARRTAVEMDGSKGVSCNWPPASLKATCNAMTTYAAFLKLVSGLPSAGLSGKRSITEARSDASSVVPFNKPLAMSNCQLLGALGTGIL